ncbi:dihydroxyacetone kinase like protein [Zymoseptoria brevis]|uniref:Dihydroxyacetone kinase like protein n=1 Tax=Zymoseptoria brevis TaxID=1047168 RepID=A0A0F4GQA0_9PEZI|nr:dihydroxyacetone kinase like protein [Zymoseptoria brevis]
MASKHFINDPTHLVNSALESITLTNPNTAYDSKNKIVYLRPDATKPQVSIVSGGGSGHEPSFAAFVGPGLLSGAVAGTIFASPSAEQVRRCILERVETSKGALVVVMNYTGDVLNFGMAVEKAKAAGLDVRMVVMGDDAGVGRAQGGKVGRRGIAGTVFIHKIAGALAAAGASLDDVEKVAKAVAENTVSIGSSLSHVHVPGRDVSSEEEESLKKDEIEIGMGIHNENGAEVTKNDLPTTVKTMLKYMLDAGDQDRGFLKVDKSNETVLLINNLGGVSVLELGGITTEVVKQLEQDYGIKPVRVLAGTFMTSLNGLGFSISLLKVMDLGGQSVLELLDAPSEAAGWSAAISSKTWTNKPSQTRETGSGKKIENKPCGISLDPPTKTALAKALDRVIAAEPDVTKYDTVVGDGDCGIGLKRGAEGIKKYLDSGSDQKDAALFVDGIVEVVESDMDGTSGALYAIFLNAVAYGLRQQSGGSGGSADAKVWAKALDTAVETLGQYTQAKVGDRTLVDALAPFVEQLNSTSDVQKAAQAADEGAKKTKGMKANLGRTVYVGGSGYEEVPDPGAHGLAEFFKGLAEALR